MERGAQIDHKGISAIWSFVAAHVDLSVDRIVMGFVIVYALLSSA